jgi:hypothetical protein
VDGTVVFTVPLPIGQRGFNAITLAVDPPCPRIISPVLACESVALDGLTLTPLSAGPLYDPVQLGAGVSLAGSYLPPERIEGDVLPVRLWWQFDEARSDNDVRFIHVLDANGQQVAGIDQSPGARAAGESLAELVFIDLPEPLSGTFDVYTGWYTFPDLVRFPVLADTRRAQDGLIYLGQVTVR